MPNSSKDYQVGSIKFAPNFGPANLFPDTSSSKQPQTVSFHVPIAQDPEFHITFLLGYLKKLWMKHHYTEKYPFHCTCLENPCSILELLKSLTILREEDMRLFLQRMEFCLDECITNCGGLTKSSGVTKKKSKSQKRSKRGKTSR